MTSIIERQLDQAMQTAERAQKRIDFLLSLPEEPECTDPDGALVVWFQRTFRNKTYTYAATKSGMWWYVTGATMSGSKFLWHELLAWAQQDQREPVQFWLASEFTAI